MSLKHRIIREGIKYDPMNLPFVMLQKRHRKVLVLNVLVLTSIAVYFVYWVKYLGQLITISLELRLLTVFVLGICILLYLLWGIYYRHFEIELAMLRRELWFVEYRLGLPLTQEELEDVDAYDEWLKNYIKEKVGEGE